MNKIPDYFLIGPIQVDIELLPFDEVESDYQDDVHELYDNEYLLGFYELDPARIVIRDDLSPQRTENVLFHELGHAIVDIIFSHHYSFNEYEVQAHGNGDQQIVQRCMEVNYE